MRLAILILIALFAGCLGPSHSDRFAGTEDLPGDSDARNHPTAASQYLATDPNASGTPGNGTQPDSTSSAPHPRSAPQPPPPIHEEGTSSLVEVPFFPPYSECSHPLVDCSYSSFRLVGAFDLEATLSWDLPTNDLDLFLTRQANGANIEISRNGDNDASEPTTQQVLHYAGLPPGDDYRLWIAPQHGVRISWTLDVVFSTPAANHAFGGSAPAPPAPIHWEGSMGPVALPAVGPWSECETPLTGCDGPSFITRGTFGLQATLSWDLPTTDLDLVLVRQTDGTDTEISRDGDNNLTEPTTRQVLHDADLPPGSYRLWVVPQHGVKTDFVLDVEFS